MNNSKILNIIPIAIFIVVFFAAKKIFDMVLNLLGQKNEQLIEQTNQDSLDSAKKEIDESYLTYSKSQYYNFADGIYTALQGSFSEDEMSVWNVFKKIKTNDDFLQLTIAYGIRPVGFIGFRTPMNLSQSIRALFSNNEINTCNYLLKKNGVTKTI